MFSILAAATDPERDPFTRAPASGVTVVREPMHHHPSICTSSSAGEAVCKAPLSEEAPRHLDVEVSCASRLLGLSDKKRAEEIAHRTAVTSKIIEAATELQERFLKLNELIEVYRTWADPTKEATAELLQACKDLQDEEDAWVKVAMEDPILRRVWECCSEKH